MRKLIIALAFWCSFSVASAENEVALKGDKSHDE
jgi:hypothetical protein